MSEHFKNIEFVPEDSYYLNSTSGRGIVFTGKCPIDVPRDQLFTEFSKYPIKINDKLWTVIGVESHAIPFQSSLNRPIGLLVEALGFEPYVHNNKVGISTNEFDHHRFDSVEEIDAFIEKLTECRNKVYKKDKKQYLNGVFEWIPAQAAENEKDFASAAASIANLYDNHKRKYDSIMLGRSCHSIAGSRETVTVLEEIQGDKDFIEQIGKTGIVKHINGK